jgi:hypothetical protein
MSIRDASYAVSLQVKLDNSSFYSHTDDAASLIYQTRDKLRVQRIRETEVDKVNVHMLYLFGNATHHS